MVRNGKIIKPLCLCGGGKGFGALCNISTVKTIEEHSKRDKHLLFKSVIKLIHYRRRARKLKPIIDKINKDTANHKKSERIPKEDGGGTTVSKTDKEIAHLWESYLRPIDENITHQPREPYINKVDYDDYYKDEVMYMRLLINPLTL